jgi:hypothetical protein
MNKYLELKDALYMVVQKWGATVTADEYDVIDLIARTSAALNGGVIEEPKARPATGVPAPVPPALPEQVAKPSKPKHMQATPRVGRGATREDALRSLEIRHGTKFYRPRLANEAQYEGLLGGGKTGGGRIRAVCLTSAIGNVFELSGSQIEFLADGLSYVVCTEIAGNEINSTIRLFKSFASKATAKARNKRGSICLIVKNNLIQVRMPRRK